MYRLILFSLLLCLLSCRESRTGVLSADARGEVFQQRRTLAGLDSLFSASNLTGSILLYDESSDSLFSNDFGWKAEGALPASTFKIANTVIGLELELLKDQNTVFEWDGTERNNAGWNQDLTVQQAFARSCVPCYRGLARSIGAERMNDYLRKLNYADITVTPDSVDVFWLLGSARTSPLEQLRFPHNIKNQSLPLRPETYTKLSAIMRRPEGKGYKLYGKTGWSIDRGQNNGWFVGYAVAGERTVYVIVNVEPVNEFDREVLLTGRMAIALAGIRAILDGNLAE
ncbi:class D beta-lactamase [Neolewinella antarctica]|uniref:beta-lactamase n=1 Tax=Neolewinella antarctica TaxID=442734 RepID=A0ABX0XH19_9BACT|nr:class D beta-lactamase [Neolewinella antarctica]NJC28445.1 beta-lactamase class D [Neolewinella antarctica]